MQCNAMQRGLDWLCSPWSNSFAISERGWLGERNKIVRTKLFEFFKIFWQKQFYFFAENILFSTSYIKSISTREEAWSTVVRAGYPKDLGRSTYIFSRIFLILPEWLVCFGGGGIFMRQISFHVHEKSLHCNGITYQCLLIWPKPRLTFGLTALEPAVLSI